MQTAHRYLVAPIIALLVLGSAGAALAASGLRVTPFEYDPGKTRAVAARWVTHAGLVDAGGSDHALYLAKKTATSTNAAGVAIVDGVDGLILGELGFDYRNDSHCGAGAPRFNVYLSSGAYFFFGCAYGTHTPQGTAGWTRVRFGNADAFAADGVTAWPGFGNAAITDIEIVFDEGTDAGNGYAYLDNVDVNGTLIGKPGNTAINTGSWSLFGDATGAAGDGQPAPSVELSSVGTGFSGVAFESPTAFTFSQLWRLSADYRATTGDCHGGSLRFQVGIDTDGDGDRDGNLFVYFGDYPNFASGCALAWHSSGNFIGSADLRFDTSQFTGGSFYDTYAHALSLFGSKTVTGVQLVADGGWGGDQVFNVDNVTVNGTVLQGP